MIYIITPCLSQNHGETYLSECILILPYSEHFNDLTVYEWINVQSMNNLSPEGISWRHTFTHTL